MSKYIKVILLGFSGLDYKVLKGLMAANHLPVFRKLIEKGSLIKLDTVMPAENIVTWISLTTGLNPGQHNLFSAITRDPLTYAPKLALINSIEKNVKPFWELIKEAGITVSSNWWCSEFSASTVEEDWGESTDKQLLLQQIKKNDWQHEQTFLGQLTEFKAKERGFFGFRFDYLNQLQHLFWNDKLIGKNNEKIKLNKAVIDYYIQKDLLLRQVLESLDDNTCIMIVSNHGMTSLERSFNLNQWLVKNNYLQLIPELNKLNEDPLWQIADWDTTRAYAVGFTSIYLNLEHREGKGIVQDKEPLLKELVSKLTYLTDPATEERVIHKVYRKEDLYRGNYLLNAPDLIIGFKPGYRASWQTAVGKFKSPTIDDPPNDSSGNHLVDSSFVPGALITNLKTEKISAHILDIAPTILELMGIKKTSEMTGTNLIIRKS